MDKQVFDLTPRDFDETPVWFFPMDDSVEDEETVRPAEDASQIDDFQVVVKTHFYDQEGNGYLGYIYWGSPEKVEYLKPVMFFSDDGESGLTFWNGMFEVTPIVKTENGLV